MIYNEIQKEIIIDGTRRVYTREEYDITIIENNRIKS